MSSGDQWEGTDLQELASLPADLLAEIRVEFDGADAESIEALLRSTGVQEGLEQMAGEDARPWHLPQLVDDLQGAFTRLVDRLNHPGDADAVRTFLRPFANPRMLDFLEFMYRAIAARAERRVRESPEALHIAKLFAACLDRGDRVSAEAVQIVADLASYGHRTGADRGLLLHPVDRIEEDCNWVAASSLLQVYADLADPHYTRFLTAVAELLKSQGHIEGELQVTPRALAERCEKALKREHPAFLDLVDYEVLHIRNAKTHRKFEFLEGGRRVRLWNNSKRGTVTWSEEYNHDQLSARLEDLHGLVGLDGAVWKAAEWVVFWALVEFRLPVMMEEMRVEQAEGLPAMNAFLETGDLSVLNEADGRPRRAFRVAVDGLYAQHDNHILPFIGDGFEHPQPGDLRMLVLGINCYTDEWPLPDDSPGWFRGWFETERWRFFKGARSALRELGSALEQSTVFGGLRYRDPGSAYATNMVKNHLPRSIGRHAVDVPDDAFERGERTWKTELGLMARFGVFPHVVVVLGSRFWPTACRTFQGPLAFTAVHEHTWTGSVSIDMPAGPSLHFVNRYEVEVGDERQPVLLVRIYHPSARKPRDADGTPKGTVQWLLKQPDFRGVAGLPE
jgi:hypothetical protein